MSTQRIRISPLGDSGAVITFGREISPDIHREVMAFSDLIEGDAPEATVEHVPAFTTVTVFYDPLRSTYEDFVVELRALIERMPAAPTVDERHVVEIPVCYGEDLGPDLPFVASHSGLGEAEVVTLHSEPNYLCYMIGFAPGFPYLGGMSERIAAPRRESPRDAIPEGSVGIAGNQTGVYPIRSPGGWQLIGRTPLRLFRPDRDPPTLIQAGDRVRFAQISRSDYAALLERENDE